jgi:hypothetical protein
MVPMGATSKLGLLFLASLSWGAGACSTASASAPPRPVVAAPPPKDDGKSAQGGTGGERHSAALEQLKIAPLTAKSDKQGSVLVPLPDAEHWTRVRFLTLPSLVGFRYGKEHHAIVAGFVIHVEDNMAEGACNKSFEQWAMPFVEAFEVELKHDPPTAFSWTLPPSAPASPKTIAIVDVDPVFAKTATILSRESYHAAWAAYPAWEKACLVMGVAVPVRDDDGRAREVRDRFLKDVFPKITVVKTAEPKERF